MPNGQIGIPAYPWLEQGMALPGGIKSADYFGEIEDLHSTYFSGLTPLWSVGYHDDIGLSVAVVSIGGVDYDVIKFPHGLYWLSCKLRVKQNANEFIGEVGFAYPLPDGSGFLISDIETSFYIPAGADHDITVSFSGLWQSYNNGPDDIFETLGFCYYDYTGNQAYLVNSGLVSHIDEMFVLQLKAGNLIP